MKYYSFNAALSLVVPVDVGVVYESVGSRPRSAGHASSARSSRWVGRNG